MELDSGWSCGWLFLGAVEFLGRLSLGIFSPLSEFLAGVSNACFRLHRLHAFRPGNLCPLSISIWHIQGIRAKDFYQKPGFCSFACILFGVFLSDRYFHSYPIEKSFLKLRKISLFFNILKKGFY